jgi:hypothetical protein
MRSTSRKKSLLTAALVVLLVGAGSTAAFAYWTSTGSGSGTATTGTAASVTVNQTSTVTNLRPGSGAQTLSGTFTNTTGSNVYVNTVTVSIASVTKAVGAVAGVCDASDYTLSGATVTVNQDVANGTGVGTWSGATIAFTNKAVAQDQCKGATVNLSYVAA